MSQYDKWLLIEDAAKMCGISRSRISHILKHGWAGGTFRTAIERGRIVINPKDVSAFMHERKVGNPTAEIAKHAQKGGRARAKQLSAKRRSAISAQGAKARYAKKDESA